MGGTFSGTNIGDTLAANNTTIYRLTYIDCRKSLDLMQSFFMQKRDKAGKMHDSIKKPFRFLFGIINEA